MWARAKKSLGQHFLMHKQIAERIADAANLTKTSTVLEIGAGTGILTSALLARAKNVIAVETDKNLVTQLRTTFAKNIADGTLMLLDQDIRTFDPQMIGTPYVLVANIPYYLTSDIFHLFLQSRNKPLSITLLVQKEVAERIARNKKESVLSLSVKAYGVPRYVFTVPRGAFIPAPSVDSAVLSVANICSPFQNAAAENAFDALIRAAFAHKRKLLARNLEIILQKSVILDAFLRVGIPTNARAEDIALEKWLRLAKCVQGSSPRRHP